MPGCVKFRSFAAVGLYESAHVTMYDCSSLLSDESRLFDLYVSPVYASAPEYRGILMDW